MDTVGFECCLGEREFWTLGCVDPLGLRRVDVVFAPLSEEGCSLGRHPDWFDHQWAVEGFHDVCHAPDVCVRVLHRCHRRPRDLWFVLIDAYARLCCH